MGELGKRGGDGDDAKAGAPEPADKNEWVSAFIGAYKNEQETNRRQEGNEDRSRRWREWATLLFVILTTGGIFYQDFVLTKSDDAIHTSAAAAKTAADAAKGTVEANIASERARLFLLPSFIRSGPQDPDPKIGFQITNMGRTAALVAGLSFDCKLGIPPEPNSSPIYDNKRYKSGATMIPAGNILPTPPGSECRLDTPLTAGDFSDLSNKRKAIIYVGFIRFQTVFGKTFTKHVGFYSFGDDQFYPFANADAYNAETEDR